MAIVKYTFVNKSVPAGLTHHGYFHHTSDETWIGVGNAGGTNSANKTELSITELKAYAKTITTMRHITFSESSILEAAANNSITNRAFTDAEIDTMVDEWCTEVGIS